LPVVTVLGLLAPILIGATAVIESVFAMPGVGRLAVEAALGRDYPTIMTLNFLTATLVLVGNALVDVSYVVLDPRIRLE
jgi:peptide/nickel transport system permease protein